MPSATQDGIKGNVLVVLCRRLEQVDDCVEIPPARRQPAGHPDAFLPVASVPFLDVPRAVPNQQCVHSLLPLRRKRLEFLGQLLQVSYFLPELAVKGGERLDPSRNLCQQVISVHVAPKKGRAE